MRAVNVRARIHESESVHCCLTRASRSTAECDAPRQAGEQEKRGTFLPTRLHVPISSVHFLIFVRPEACCDNPLIIRGTHLVRFIKLSALA